MYVRAYLRASTQQQDATRAKEALTAFAQQHGQKVAAYYVENQSGASLRRPELFRLLDDAHPGDVLLIEQVDRLSRLTEDDWQQLRQTIRAKGVLVVALDLPTSHQSMQQSNADEFTGRMLAAINNMLLDMLAAIARKDYEDRRRRQAQGIEKAKAKGAFKGKQIDKQLHQRILTCLAKGMSIREAAAATGASTATVQRAKNRAAESEAG